MKNVLCTFSLIVAVLVVADSRGSNRTSAAPDPHAYFNALASRGEAVKSFSLRDAGELSRYRKGGTRAEDVTYDPARDTDPRRQDAAKVVVSAFPIVNSLAAPVGSGDTTLTLVQPANTLFVRNAQVKVGGEVMTITSDGNNRMYTISVSRGDLGTTPRAHPAGIGLGMSNLSLRDQVFLPLGTEDGHSYLFTWDAWYGAETRRHISGLKNWKAFRFDGPRRIGDSSPGAGFQVNMNFAEAENRDQLGRADARMPSPLGPNVTKQDPLSPMVGSFVVMPETWVRYWVLVEQRPNDWDLVSLWVADENKDAVQIVDRLQIEAFGNIQLFRVEFNTSTYTVASDFGKLVSYVRNFVMLQDVAAPRSLMQRPVAGLLPPPPGQPSPQVLAPPANVRVVQ